MKAAAAGVSTRKNLRVMAMVTSPSLRRLRAMRKVTGLALFPAGMFHRDHLRERPGLGRIRLMANRAQLAALGQHRLDGAGVLGMFHLRAMTRLAAHPGVLA